MKHIYYGYGARFLSNFPLRGLSETNCEDEVALIEVEVNVTIERDFQTGNVYSLQRKNGLFILDLHGIVYSINRYSINVITNHKELFYSTFYNIPLSILFVLHNRILLHSSAFVRDGQLYPICAEKGIGKSTLVTYAYYKGNKFFCDDTLPLILIDDEIYAVSGTDFVKLNSDSCMQLQVTDFYSLKKNINNKVYLNLRPYERPIKLKKLYFMSKNHRETETTVINSKLFSKALVLSSVVGILWFSEELVSMIVNDKIYDNLCNNIQLIKFNVVENWENLDSNYLHLIKMVEP